MLGELVCEAARFAVIGQAVLLEVAGLARAVLRRVQDVAPSECTILHMYPHSCSNMHMDAAETPVTLTADRYGRRIWQHTAPTAAQLATVRAERATRPAPARDPFARIPHTDTEDWF